MKTSTLHITNGDSTTQILNKIGIQDKIITWREMLCEGKTTVDVGSETFWKQRFDFFKTSYKISKKQFIDFTLKEYRNLCKQKEQDEIVLWFEYDLFCQINMLAVISWLKRYRKDRKITLVCSGEIGESTKLYSLSELTKPQLKNHFKNRVELTEDDLDFADYVWQLYCSENPLQLETVYKYQQNTQFRYLTASLLAHLQRFPTIKNGLNTVENAILTTASQQSFESKSVFVQTLLQNQQNYGFGDLQYFKKLDELKSLFQSFTPVKLNSIGKKTQQQLLNVYGTFRNDFSFLGGAKKYNFLYDDSAHKLLKITSL